MAQYEFPSSLTPAQRCSCAYVRYPPSRFSAPLSAFPIGKREQELFDWRLRGPGGGGGGNLYRYSPGLLSSSLSLSLSTFDLHF